MAALEQTDVVVYIEPAPSVPNRSGRLTFMAANRAFRMFRISLDMRNQVDDQIKWLGHELVHALEVAMAPEVRSEADMKKLYARIGRRVDGGPDEVLHEAPQRADEPRAARAVQQHPAEQQPEDRDERVDHELLIGPVVLRPKDRDPRVLEIAERPLDSRLPAIRLDDGGGAPRVLGRRQHPQAEVALLERGAARRVNDRVELHLALARGRLHVQDLADILAIADPPHAGLGPRQATPRMPPEARDRGEETTTTVCSTPCTARRVRYASTVSPVERTCPSGSSRRLRPRGPSRVAADHGGVVCCDRAAPADCACSPWPRPVPGRAPTPHRRRRSRPWLTKWVAQFKPQDWAGLTSRSRRPRRLRRRVPPQLAARIVALRTELEAHQTRRSRYRGVGALEIQELLRAEGRRSVPSLRTIERVLRAHGCGRRRRADPGGSPPYPAPRATRPGDLVQTDLVGPRYLRGQRRAVRFYSLHSIAVVGRGTWTSQHRYKTRDAFCAHFLGSWGHLGVPRVSQLDNEMAATGGGRHAFGLSAVVRLHLLVGSRLLSVPPGERLRRHRDQLRWLPPDFSLASYRGRRGQLPVARGRVSWIQRVDAEGRITINARPYLIGTRRTGEYVQATLFTHRQRLVVYAATRRRLKVFRFPIHDGVIDPVL